MKLALLAVALNMLSLSFLAVAGYLAAHDKNGWGWFLFAAIICAVSLKVRETE